MSGIVCIQFIIAIITSLPLMWRKRWRKKEMEKGREGSELTLNFYSMPGALQFSIYSFEVGFIHSFSPAHLPLCPFTEDINEHDKCYTRGDHWMPWEQRKDNCLSRIIKEDNTEDATFELGLKGWVGVWEAKTSNHFIIHNIWGLDC